MAQGDFTLTATADFSSVLKGFAAAESQARQSGERIGTYLDGGIKKFSTTTLAGLQAELNRLQERQLVVAVNTTQVDVLGQKIADIQGKIGDVQRKQLAIGVDDRSIVALQSKLQELQTRQVKVDVNGQEFVDLQRQINVVAQEFTAIERKRLLINVDDKSITALQSKLQELQSKQTKLSVDNSQFRALQTEIDKVQAEIAETERKKLVINVDSNSVTAITTRLQSELDRLQQRQLKVNVDSQSFVVLQRQIDQVQEELTAVERKRLLVSVDSRSITALQLQLQSLETKQTKVSVDSREFLRLGTDIEAVKGKISEIERRKILIGADAGSVIALRSRLGELQGELDKVKIGSQRFRELQGEIRKVEGDLNKAGQGARGFGGALSALQSIPFLAAFASLGGIISLFKGAIDQAVQLETTTRKLSNTLGQQGAAGALNFTKGLADSLGLSFGVLSGTFSSFTAAATAANVPMQAQEDLFASVSRAAQSLGLSNDALQGSLYALQQVASKGTVQMEELRGQLGERLPIAFGATAKGLGITQRELIKLVESGKLTAGQFFPALTKGLNELVGSSGAVPTAAQNFGRLDNAWKELQVSFGQNQLPTVVAAVQKLTAALEGLRVEESARELQRAFGLPLPDAITLAAAINNVQKEYSLTWQEAKNLLSVQIQAAGAGKNMFGQLILGGEKFSKVQLGLIDAAIAFRNANPDMTAQKNAEVAELAKQTEELLKAAKLEEQRKQSALEITKIYGQAQVEGLSGQIALGNQLVQLTQSLGALEQSRYSITRSQLEYELQKAQEREASETTIKTIKRAIEEQDRQALSARYQALQLEQQLQEGLLWLSQEKARQEADLSILQQRIEILKAEQAVGKAKTEEEKAAAEAQLSVQKTILGIQFEKRNALTQTQPIEAAIAGIQRETADNALRAEAAAKGFKLEADGSLTPMRGLAGTVGRVAELTVGAKDSVADYSQLAAQAGLQIGRAKDGTIVLGQSWEDVKRQVTDINAGLGGIVFNTSNAQGAADQYNQKASASQRITGEIVDGVIQIQQEFDIATGKAGTFDAEVSGASGTTDNIATGVGGIKTALEKVLGPAAAMVGAFTSAGDEAPKAVTAAQGFAGALSTANSAGAAIKGINLDDYMGAVSTNTGNAASAARDFYGWLQKAANLPAGRWTGGPVEGGETYKVNELGQEALLSGGRLSLINAPSGGTWRAPSSGVVVPAGITAELQARGALPGRAARLTGGGSAIAEQAAVGAQQAVVLGKLEAAVDRLSRKDWNVNVTMRQGPTGSQVIRHLNRLL